MPASRSASKSLEDLSDEQIEATFDVNIFAMFALSRAALQVIPEGGSIINTTSIQAFDPSDHLMDYAGDQGRYQQLHQIVGIPGGEEGHPGQRRGARSYLDSAAALPRPAHRGAAEVRPRYLAGPGRARRGTAPAYVFLASDEQKIDVVGSTVHVNGGKNQP